MTKQYRCILPDGLVHPLEAWRVWQLLDYLQVNNIAIIGHSAGGMLGREMIRLQPERVWAFVCLDSNGATGNAILTLARNLPAERFSAKAAVLYAENRAQMLSLAARHQGDYPSRVTIEQRTRAYRRARMSPEEIRRTENRKMPEPMIVLADSSPPPSIPDEGKFIPCPTLLIQTGRGKFGAENLPRDWVRNSIQAKQVEYEVIREAGHWPWLESPGPFIKRILRFLQPLQNRE